MPQGERATWSGGRDLGVDLARGIAIVAMIIAHVKVWWPFDHGAVGYALAQVNNLASPLFCLLMGVSAGIVLTRPRDTVRGTPFVLRNVVRGIVLVAVGLLLEQLDTFVAIVLQALGVVLVVGSPLVLLPVWAVGALVLTTFVLGPEANELARTQLEPTSSWALARLREWTLLSPYYRLTNLLPFFLAGALLARRGLRTPDLRLVTLAGLAGLVFVVAWRLTGHDLAISGTLADNVSDLGLSFTALGLTILAARTAALRRVVHALIPVAAVGALPFTAYVLHVALIALVLRIWDPGRPWSAWPLPSAAILLLTVLGGWLWWTRRGRGPIERTLALVTDRIR